MVSSIQKNVSALNALSTDMSVSANNIANSNTRGFRPTDATLVESENNGVQVTLSQGATSAQQEPAPPEAPGALEQPGELYTRQGRTGGQQPTPEDNTEAAPERSEVNLVREIVDTIPTKRAYGANVKTIQAQEEMMGAMLDIKA